MPENKVKQLTHGALMAAIFVIIVLISMIPGINIVSMWFMPLPLIWYAAKYDLKSSIIVLTVAIIISILFTGLIAGILSIGFAIIAITIGYSIRTNASKIQTVMSATVASIFFFVLTYFSYSKLAGINIIDSGKNNAETAIKQAKEMNERLGLNQNPMLTDKNITKVIDLMNASVPSGIIMASVMLAMVIILINFPMVKKLGIEVPKFNAFKDLRLPRIVLFMYLLTMVVDLFVRPEQGTYFYLVVINLTIIFSLLFLIQGISFIHFFVHLKEMPKFLAWGGTVLAIPLNSFVILLGIIDLGFDLRSLLSDKTKK